MTVDISTIEAGDKAFTRDGGCLVAYEDGNSIWLGLARLTALWKYDGVCVASKHLDIIRIEKATKPVVEEVYIAADELGTKDWRYTTSPECYKHAIKLTIINGKLEKSEQVK